MPNTQGEKPEMEFNFRQTVIADVDEYDVETLCEQLDEMGWQVSITYTNPGDMRIELNLKEEKHPSPEETLVRISGTILKQRPQDQIHM